MANINYLPLPELEVIRGWIRNVDEGPPLTGNVAASVALRRYRDALATLPLEQQEDECAKLARLDKNDLVFVLALFVGINAPDRGNDPADV
jgi:hypothetical protein